MLMHRITMKNIIARLRYLSGSVKVWARGKVSRDVMIRETTMPNFLRPYLTNVNLYTRGAVTNLKLKGRYIMLK